MIVINFSHPLTPEQLEKIAKIAGREIERVIEVPTQLDITRAFAPQVVELVDSVGLAPEEWQKLPIVINPPALSAIAVLVIAELHGRMGYFPPCVRLRQVRSEAGVSVSFEVAEILSLQEQREQARQRRQRA